MEKPKTKEEWLATVELRKAYIAEARAKVWENLPRFLKPADVPALPTGIDAETWKAFYVEKLVGAGALAKDNLVDGTWYNGEYRNAEFGRWDAKNQKFGHWRWKFGWRWDEANHFEDDDGYALFVPIRTATEEETKIEEEKNK